MPSTDDIAPPDAGQPVYRFAPGVTLLFADGLPLLFSETEQKLIGLDRLAGYVACRCDVGVRADELARDLAGRGLAPDEATDLVERLFGEWSQHRLLAVSFGADGAGPVADQLIGLAGHAARIRCFDGRVAKLVGAAFAGLERPSRSSVATYDVRCAGQLAFVIRTGRSSAVVPVDGAVPALKAYLMYDLLAGIGNRVALHAACLVRRGRALLLCGAPGAGKTTLALQLAASGFALASDDITLLDDRGRVEGVPFPAAVKTGSWKLVERTHPGFAQAAVHVRADGKRVRYLAPDLSVPAGPIRAGGIVMLRRRRGVRPRLTAIETAATLTRLLGEAATPSATLSADMLRSLVTAVANARCVELEYDTADGAVGLLKRLVDDAEG